MNPQHSPDRDGPLGERLSALCDGCLDEQALDQLLASSDESATGLHASWHSYQVIGDVLRGQYAGPASCPPGDFLAAVRSRLDAADGTTSDDPAVPPPRQDAANDPVFRWKLVSGFASLVAVVAIGWNLLSAGPAAGVPGETLARSAGPAPALAVATPSAPAEALTPASRTVVVATPQGRIIRDASLERLMAEHRQHGGMSAFQNSTGFIRNATYDADAR